MSDLSKPVSNGSTSVPVFDQDGRDHTAMTQSGVVDGQLDSQRPASRGAFRNVSQASDSAAIQNGSVSTSSNGLNPTTVGEGSSTSKPIRPTAAPIQATGLQLVSNSTDHASSYFPDGFTGNSETANIASTLESNPAPSRRHVESNGHSPAASTPENRRGPNNQGFYNSQPALEKGKFLFRRISSGFSRLSSPRQ
jgi:hypothetical protein